MAYETLDPKNCAPILPVNTINQKATFFKISLFEKEIPLKDIFDTGRGHSGNRYPSINTSARLGLPASVLYPYLSDSLQGQHIISEGNQPLQTDATQVYMPLKEAIEEPQVFSHFISDRSLKQRRIRLSDDSSIELQAEQVRRLQAGLPVNVKTKKGLIHIRRQIYNPNIISEVSQKNASFALHTAWPPPENLTDYSYDVMLGELLSDPRSELTEYGRNVSQLDSTTLSDEAYDALLKRFMDNPRYQSYMTKFEVGSLRLPKYEIGLISHYEQEWELLGYSRGSLISSMTLAPGEELTVEIFSWDKQKIDNEKSLTTEFERNTDVSNTVKATSQIVRNVSEKMNSELKLGAKIPLPIDGFPVKPDVNFKLNNEVKESLQNTIDNLDESTSRSVEKFKSTNQVKVIQSHDFGREDRVTRKLQNRNGSKTITYNYFEILENYEVTTKLRDTKNFCLLVENPNLGKVDLTYVLAYQNVLQKALLSPTYINGFEAAKILAAQDWFEADSMAKAELEAQKRKADEENHPKSFIKSVAENLVKALQELHSADIGFAGQVFTAQVLFQPVRESDRRKAESDLGLWNYWFKLKTISPNIDTKSQTFIADMESASSDGEIYDVLSLFVTGLDDDWAIGLKMIAANLIAAQLGLALIPVFPLLTPILLQLAFIENNNGLPALISKAKKEIKDYEITIKAVQSEAEVPPQEEPLQIFSLQELALAHAEYDKLRLHIEANRVYYDNQIWRNEDPNDRYERLRFMGLNKYVENTLLGFIGNRSVYPLPLSALSKYTRDQLITQFVSFNPEIDENLANRRTKKILPRVQSASLPTPGVYMESMLGQCEGLEEFLLTHRELDMKEKEEKVRLLSAKTNKEEQEVERFKLRLQQTPPLLDDPVVQSEDGEET